MIVGKFKCKKCKAVFEQSCEIGAHHSHSIKCPKCGSAELDELPAWVPLTYNMDLYDSPSQWQYECKDCKANFEMPVPSGPTEERNRKCPTCGSGNIERLTALAIEPPLYCG